MAKKSNNSEGNLEQSALDPEPETPAQISLEERLEVCEKRLDQLEHFVRHLRSGLV